MSLAGKNVVLWRAVGLVIFAFAILLLAPASHEQSILPALGAVALAAFGMTLAVNNRKRSNG